MQTENNPPQARPPMTRRTLRLCLANLIAWSVLFHLYVLFRFDFDWLSGDAAIFTQVIQSVQTTGTLEGFITYPYGFGYQVIVVFLSEVTSISIVNLQLFALPLMGAVPAILVYPLFQRLINDKPGALLAAYLFGIQSDVLFTTFRSTHEKFTWILIGTIMLLFVLTIEKKSTSRSLGTVLGSTLATYGSMFALFSLNLFFANTFLLILVIGLLVGLSRSRGPISRSLQRLAYLCTLGSVLFFSFILYTYGPALLYLKGLANYGQVILTAVLSFENQSTPQYQYVLDNWPSIYVWIVLTLVTWVLLGLTAFSFISIALLRRRRNHDPLFSLLRYLWIGAVIVLGGGVLADRFGGYSSNLELRLVPVVILFSAPIAAFELMRWVRSHSHLSRSGKTAVVLSLLLVLTPISLMKATAEPSISNIRIYVTPDEKAAILWTMSTEFDGPIWTDPGGRMISEARFFEPITEFPKYSSRLQGSNSSKYYMVSGIVLYLYPTQVMEVSSATDARIYTNGDTSIFMHGQ